MPDSPTSKFGQDQEQPLFMAIPSNDVGFEEAYAKAARTIPQFIKHIQSGMRGHFAAKLSFRDPDESERLGEDQLLFLWLSAVQYHPVERLFTAKFFEVPPELQKWHQVGQQLTFEGEDIFDWMALNEDGRLFGGYTLRVSRSKLPENQRTDYDRYIGVKAYEPDA
jgi:uncharacterized protein YegJ (DUF2314 family)